MKKILKWLGIVIGGLVLLVVIAGAVLIMIVDKEMIAAQMQKALNRQVTIGAIDVSIFSVLSGIEVKEVAVSNFKTPEELNALKGKPVAKSDLFAGMKSFNFKVRILPLISGKVELRELVLYEPVINVVRYKSGLFNFSDLVAPKKMTPQEKAELMKKQREEAKKKAAEAKKPVKPFTADDLPVAVSIGKVGTQKGTLTFVDQGSKQTLQVYNLTALVYDISIDPKNLANANLAKLKVETGVRTVGKMTTGSVDSFDIGLSVNGTVKPFDLKSRLVNPEIAVKAGSPYGTMTGLQIFDKLNSVEKLQKYCGKFDFLKDKVKWKDGFLNLWYKGGVAKISDGRINAGDFLLKFGGTVNTSSKAVDMDMEMLVDQKHARSVRSGVEKNAGKALKTAKLDKYLKPDKVADAAMKPLLDKDGRIDLGYKVTGTMSKPKAALVKPKLPTIEEVVKDAAKDVGDIAKKKAEEAAKDKAKDIGKDAGKKAGKDLKKLKKKLF